MENQSKLSVSKFMVKNIISVTVDETIKKL